MNRNDVAARAEQARYYLGFAQLGLMEEGSRAAANVAGANAVLSGIAAADAITGHALGLRSAGDSHAEAVELLSKVDSKSSAVASLKRLLAAKTSTQYDPQLIGQGRARELLAAAERLVAEMDRILLR